MEDKEKILILGSAVQYGKSKLHDIVVRYAISHPESLGQLGLKRIPREEEQKLREKVEKMFSTEKSYPKVSLIDSLSMLSPPVEFLKQMEGLPYYEGSIEAHHTGKGDSNGLRMRFNKRGGKW